MYNIEVCNCFLFREIVDNRVVIRCGFIDNSCMLFLPHMSPSPEKYMVESAKDLALSYTDFSNIIDMFPSKFFDPYEIDKKRNTSSPIHLVYEVYIKNQIENMEFLDYEQLLLAKERTDDRHRRIARGILYKLQGM